MGLGVFLSPAIRPGGGLVFGLRVLRTVSRGFTVFQRISPEVLEDLCSTAPGSRAKGVLGFGS